MRRSSTGRGEGLYHEKSAEISGSAWRSCRGGADPLPAETIEISGSLPCALIKPTVAAWAVNQLSRLHHDDLDRLPDAARVERN